MPKDESVVGVEVCGSVLEDVLEVGDNLASFVYLQLEGGEVGVEEGGEVEDSLGGGAADGPQQHRDEKSVFEGLAESGHWVSIIAITNDILRDLITVIIIPGGVQAVIHNI